MKSDGKTIEVVPKGKTYNDNFDKIDWNTQPVKCDCWKCVHFGIDNDSEPCASCEVKSIGLIEIGSNYKERL